MRRVLLKAELKGVVVGAGAVANAVDALLETELWVEATAWVIVARSGHSLIQVGANKDVTAAIADVGRRDGHAR